MGIAVSTTQMRRTRLAAAAALGASGAVRAGSADLQIADLRAFPVREPVSRRAYVVLRLRTRSGIAGYGEAPAVSPAELAAVARIVVGQPATAYEVLESGLETMTGLRGAVNMALLDIIGKAARAPVYQVLGGPTRMKARALAPLAGDTDEALASSLKRAQEAGFRCFLVPVPPVAAMNQGQAFVLATRRRLEALRAAADSNANFVLDAAGRLSPGDAASLCADLEHFHLLWFDEPCRVSSLAAVRKLAAERVTPIGFGRDQTDPGLFHDLLREGAVDVLRPDISRAGVMRIRRIAAMAETYYVAVAPHHDGGPVATAAALHLAASLPNFFAQQMPWPEADADRLMRAEIAGKPVEVVREGFAELPAGPGLGIAVSEAALERYRESAA